MDANQDFSFGLMGGIKSLNCVDHRLVADIGVDRDGYAPGTAPREPGVLDRLCRALWHAADRAATALTLSVRAVR